TGLGHPVTYRKPKAASQPPPLKRQYANPWFHPLFAMGDGPNMATDHGKNKDFTGSIRGCDSSYSPVISNT
ncbi:MAG: hypothetical protein WCF13_03200, partial [Stellaceae bacterium]